MTTRCKCGGTTDVDDLFVFWRARCRRCGTYGVGDSPVAAVDDTPDPVPLARVVGSRPSIVVRWLRRFCTWISQ